MRFRTENRRRHPVARAAFASLLWLLLLGYLSYRFVYADPAQVARRIERAFARYLNVPIRVEDAGTRFFSGWEAARIVLEDRRGGSPPIELEDVHCGCGGGAPTPPPVLPVSMAGTPCRRRIHVRRAQVELRWRAANDEFRFNLEGLFTPQMPALLEGAPPFVLSASEVSLRLSAPLRGFGPWDLALGFQEVFVYPEPGRVVLAARVAPSSLSGGGRVVLYRDRAGGLTIEGSLDGLGDVERILPVLPAGVRAVFTRLDLSSGAPDLDFRLVFAPGGRVASLDARVRHYEARWASPELAGVVSHLRGETRVSLSEVVVGGPGESEAEGELWGIPCRVSVSAGKGGRRLRLRIPAVSLARVPAAEAPLPLSGILEVLRAEGTLAVEYEAVSGLEGPSAHLAVEVRDLRALGLGGLSLGRGTLEYSRRDGRGAGRLELAGFEIPGLGAVSGALQTASNGTLKLEATGLRLSARDDKPENRPAGLFGELSWNPGRSELSGFVRFGDVPLSLGFLSASLGRGEIRVLPETRAGLDVRLWRLHVSADLTLEDVRFDAGILGLAPRRLGRGRLKLMAREGTVGVTGVFEGVAETVRLRGERLPNGEVDLLAAHGRGRSAAHLAAIDLDAPPAAWRAAGEDVQFLRIRGRLDEARGRPLDFERSSAGDSASGSAERP